MTTHLSTGLKVLDGASWIAGRQRRPSFPISGPMSLASQFAPVLVAATAAIIAVPRLRVLVKTLVRIQLASSKCERVHAQGYPLPLGTLPLAS